MLPVLPCPIAACRLTPSGRPYPSDTSSDTLFLLKNFYQRLFPFKELHRWLSYGGVHEYHFLNREFSVTLATESYIRFLSFRDAAELRTEILRHCPVKIDIGAVYNIKPKDNKTVKSAAFVPIERELVFDVDMTDYDEIRTCCQGADICKKCWHFMTISIRVIDRALREDFGFKHILWVYSGRRGVHCWVSDERARKMKADARRALVSYLEVVKGGDNMAKKVNLKSSPLHPSVSASYAICSRFFAPVILGEMRVLSTPSSWNKLLSIVPDETIRKELNDAWEADLALAKPQLSDMDKWDQLKDVIKKKGKAWLNTVPRDIELQYTYPRLDTNVSIGLNHLLKSPFCVHPKTGRVCVPIDPKKCGEFDPFSVPTMQSLLDELDTLKSTADTGSSDSAGGSYYDRTSLAPYVAIFKEFLNGMSEAIRVSLRLKREEEDKKLLF
ncbi:hypothetical protein BC831DRAFT_395804 [Entophlyctis helioformis]|nr:hypothetical protein BC831DRAFT_395804 [Entophlyctis helioformis]